MSPTLSPALLEKCRGALVALFVAAVGIDCGVSIPHIIQPGGLIESNPVTLAWIDAAAMLLGLPEPLAVASIVVKDALKVALVLGICKVWPSPYDIPLLGAAAVGAWSVTWPVLVLAV